MCTRSLKTNVSDPDLCEMSERVPHLSTIQSTEMTTEDNRRAFKRQKIPRVLYQRQIIVMSEIRKPSNARH